MAGHLFSTSVNMGAYRIITTPFSLLPLASANGVYSKPPSALAKRVFWLKPSFFSQFNPSAKADGNQEFQKK
jgi:hypothetical protein